MWPTARPASAPQELADDADAGAAARAAEPAVRVAVVAAATKIKVARRPGRRDGLAIPSALRRLHRTPGLSDAILMRRSAGITVSQRDSGCQGAQSHSLCLDKVTASGSRGGVTRAAPNLSAKLLTV